MDVKPHSWEKDEKLLTRVEVNKKIHFINFSTHLTMSYAAKVV